MRPGRKPSAQRGYGASATLLGERIRASRSAASMTQEQLASSAGVSTSWLAKLERGSISEPGLFPVLSVLRELEQADPDARLALSALPQT